MRWVVGVRTPITVFVRRGGSSVIYVTMRLMGVGCSAGTTEVDFIWGGNSCYDRRVGQEIKED